MKRIVIPNPALVILCGAANSGKSTFAAKHFPPTAIVSSDRCRAMVADDEGAIWASPQAFSVFHQIIDTRLELGRLAVADSTAVNPDARKTLIQIARRRGVPTVLIALDTPEELCVQRDRGRARHVDVAVIHQQWAAFHRTLAELTVEGHHAVVVLTGPEVDHVAVEVVPAAEHPGAQAQAPGNPRHDGHQR